MGGERRPLEVPILQRVARVTEIGLSLAKPVTGAFRHGK